MFVAVMIENKTPHVLDYYFEIFSHLLTKQNIVNTLTINQRTNGPVDAHLLGLVKHKTWIIYGKELTLTFNTHIPS